MSKQLTPQISEKFAREKLQKIENPEDREFQVFHAKAVVEAALLLSEGKNIDKETLANAGWLHDIGYVISEDNHAKHSLKIVEAELKDYEISEKLKDCISNHGNNGNPQTEEGKIIQVADKVSVLHPEMIKILLNYSLKKDKSGKEKDIEFMRMIANKGFDLLKNLDS